jgi:hypothetical protein
MPVEEQLAIEYRVTKMCETGGERIVVPLGQREDPRSEKQGEGEHIDSAGQLIGDSVSSRV